MKKVFLLVVSMLLGGALFASEPSFLHLKLRTPDRNSQERSLKDILDQHGGQIEPGMSIITIDGVLKGDTPVAEAVAKLQRRAAEFKVAKDERLLRLLPMLVGSPRDERVNALLSYIQAAYGQQRSPLTEFIADILNEKKEVEALQTEALRLMNARDCRAAVSEVMRSVGECISVLAAVEQALVLLWEKIMEEYATDTQ